MSVVPYSLRYIDDQGKLVDVPDVIFRKRQGNYPLTLVFDILQKDELIGTLTFNQLTGDSRFKLVEGFENRLYVIDTRASFG